MGDRATPFFRDDEVSTLVRFLDYLREGVVGKVVGLDDDEARHPAVPSGTSLLGLVKHLTNVERLWVQYLWAGLDDVAFDTDHFTAQPSEGVSELVEGYRRTWVRNNQLVGTDGKAAQLCARARKGEYLDLRWVLVHLVEETGRHAGHADILRELIDGETGR